MSEHNLTVAERQAIAELQRLAKRWPKTLTLFGWTGSLLVQKCVKGRTHDENTVIRIDGIRCDGGDPNGDDIF